MIDHGISLNSDSILCRIEAHEIDDVIDKDWICDVFPGEIFRARFERPGSIVHFCGGHILTDRFYVLDARFVPIEESVTLNVAELRPGLEKISALSDTEVVEHLSGKWICLSSWSSKNYFHWVTQVVGSLAIIKKTSLFADARYITAPLVPWQKEILLKLDIPEDRIKEIGEGLVSCDHLYYPSDLRNEPEVIPSRVIALMRSKKEVLVGEAKAFGSKIYLSRLDSASRIMRNEGAVIDLLRQRGFQVLIAELMSAADQAAAFAGADMVVSSHGAGLTNIVFCSPGARVFEINPFADRCLFQNLAEKCGLRYSAVMSIDRQVSKDSLSPWTFGNIQTLLDKLDVVTLPGDAAKRKSYENVPVDSAFEYCVRGFRDFAEFYSRIEGELLASEMVAERRLRDYEYLKTMSERDYAWLRDQYEQQSRELARHQALSGSSS